MKLSKVKELLDAKVCTSMDYENVEVFSACGSDLMSHVLAYFKDRGLLLTGLNNPQVVRTAEMMDILCIVLVRGKEPDPAVVALAEEKDLVVMKTDCTLFTACGILYAEGLRGGGY